MIKIQLQAKLTQKNNTQNREDKPYEVRGLRINHAKRKGEVENM